MRSKPEKRFTLPTAPFVTARMGAASGRLVRPILPLSGFMAAMWVRSRLQFMKEADEMPAWKHRMDQVDQAILTLYVLDRGVSRK